VIIYATAATWMISMTVHTAPEDLEINYSDPTDSKPSCNTPEELPSLNDGSEITEHDENEIHQTEPMEIDDGAEHYCYRCHLIYYGTEMEHDPECRQHGNCMKHQRLDGPRYGYSRCDVATRIPIPVPISTLGKRLMYRLHYYTAIEPR
jgi:hypothetical protein